MIQFLLSLFLAAVPTDTDWTIVQVNDARYWSYASDALPAKLKNDVHICGPDATVYATLKAPTREQVHEAIKKAKSQKRSPDALDEVNALRARHGLTAFIRDDGLMKAAKACAQYRAANLMAGHTSNDFAYLPSGSWADAAGCAAWPPEMGWGSCCDGVHTSDGGARIAGAAWAMGADGRRYMQLFVRR